ncbi:DUF3954 domain-containing protein [Aureibacillus halotolerans]|uniref:Uncharacterized protein DUF3954 n=1 Tax=Aureibacillus halotolerans TaxID=1508390 RepID=A0A4R6TQN9_9BACI|nr:DUF3954 domain-containing protein [Aureibacillus halotolerans]TDQ35261.1 uncharacterized protein DUF3954 [Aureibacillus halotolerans]
MKKIEVDAQTMTASIPADENSVYVVRDGMVYQVSCPSSGYGEHELRWLGGRVDTCKEIKTHKFGA